MKLEELQAAYKRQCATKLRFASMREAAEMASTMEEKSGIPQHAYRCNFGLHYHIGEDRKRVARMS